MRNVSDDSGIWNLTPALLSFVMLTQVLLVVLAILGTYVSLYFTLVYYELLRADVRYIPTFCRPDERACQSVLHHSHARIFGLPNFLLGTGYYLVIIIYAVFQLSGHLGASVIVVSWFVVGLGMFLIYSLFFVVKVPCRLCLLSHGLNFLIAILLTFGE